MVYSRLNFHTLNIPVVIGREVGRTGATLNPLQCKYRLRFFLLSLITYNDRDSSSIFFPDEPTENEHNEVPKYRTVLL